MAAVTENKLIRTRNGDFNTLMEGAAGAVRLYAGTLCYFDDADGTIVDDDNGGLNPFAGIVKLEVDNSGGAAGDLNVEFYTSGVFTLPQDGTIAATEVGTLVEGIDNYTLQDDGEAGAGSLVGRVLRRIDANWIEVDIQQRA